jgi:hypothetical protein
MVALEVVAQHAIAAPSNAVTASLTGAELRRLNRSRL